MIVFDKQDVKAEIRLAQFLAELVRAGIHYTVRTDVTATK